VGLALAWIAEQAFVADGFRGYASTLTFTLSNLIGVRSMLGNSPEDADEFGSSGSLDVSEAAKIFALTLA
jgi:hypothetical protein